MKKMKTWGIVLIVLGIFCFIMGVTADTGELMDMYSSNGGKTYAEFFPLLMIASSILCAALGIYFIITDKKPIEKKCGKILGINKAIVTVEFDDGTRKKLTNIGNIPIVTNDNGMISFKGNLLVAFNKQ